MYEENFAKLQAAVQELNDLATTKNVIDHLKASGIKGKRGTGISPARNCALAAYFSSKCGMPVICSSSARIDVEGFASELLWYQHHVIKVEMMFDDGKLPELEEQ